MILKKKALPLWPDGWCVMEPINPFLLKRKNFRISIFKAETLFKTMFDYFLLSN